MEYRKHPGRGIRHILSVPFIWAMLFPLVLLDVTIEVYHQVCFRLYGLARVPRAKFIRIDRQKLSYLNWFEKLNCMYCGYGNGILRYAAEIAAETERYWCGIKHQSAKPFVPPPHHASFTPYGDERAFKKKYPLPKTSTRR